VWKFSTILAVNFLSILVKDDPSVVKAGKPFSDYELICEIQVKNGLDLGENYRNINGCKTYHESYELTYINQQIRRMSWFKYVHE
jgi:uncharacterized protein YtpQ (UPF0354 family)